MMYNTFQSTKNTGPFQCCNDASRTVLGRQQCLPCVLRCIQYQKSSSQQVDLSYKADVQCMICPIFHLKIAIHCSNTQLQHQVTTRIVLMHTSLAYNTTFKTSQRSLSLSPHCHKSQTVRCNQQKVNFNILKETTQYNLKVVTLGCFTGVAQKKSTSFSASGYHQHTNQQSLQAAHPRVKQPSCY